MSKFLVLTHIYPPAIDGGSQIIYKLSQILKSKHHHLQVITSNCHSTDDFVKPSSKPVAHSHPIHSLPVNYLFNFAVRALQKVLFPRSPWLSWLKIGPLFGLRPFIFSLKATLSQKPDFILVGPLPTTTLLYAHLFKKLSALLFGHFPKIIVVPCFHHTDPAFQNPVLLNYLAKSDFLACLTDFEKDYLKSRLITSAHIFTLGAGVDPIWLKSTKATFPTSPQLLFLGNFAAHKGILTLLNAYISLKPKFPTLGLTICGQPTLYYPQITSYLKTVPSHLRRSITIIPKKYNRSQASYLLDHSSVLILPSTQESFGLVLLEAWARRKPVIVAPAPAPSLLVKLTGGGLIASTTNPRSLHIQIEKLLTSPALASRFGQNGYSYVKNHFTWDKIGQCLLSNLGLLS